MQSNSAQGKPLHTIFTAVPPRYDLINHVITFGMDVRWRTAAARECLADKPERILDLCCGTGDLALNCARLADATVETIGIDYSQPMLERASRKAENLPGVRKISFMHGDVADLPFPDGYFDCIGISFAFRNLTYKNPMVQRYLAEIVRVLRPDGRFIIVETSQPEMKLIRTLFHLYLRWFAFRLGYLLSGNRGAYYYLAESAARFYTAGELQELLKKAGFLQVSFKRIFWGATAIHVATK